MRVRGSLIRVWIKPERCAGPPRVALGDPLLYTARPLPGRGCTKVTSLLGRQSLSYPPPSLPGGPFSCDVSPFMRRVVFDLPPRGRCRGNRGGRSCPRWITPSVTASRATSPKGGGQGPLAGKKTVLVQSLRRRWRHLPLHKGGSQVLTFAGCNTKGRKRLDITKLFLLFTILLAVRYEASLV